MGSVTMGAGARMGALFRAARRENRINTQKILLYFSYISYHDLGRDWDRFSEQI